MLHHKHKYSVSEPSRLLPSSGMEDVAAEARRMIHIVAEDPGLPRFIRHNAVDLETLLDRYPDLVWERLDAMRRSFLSDLPLVTPCVDYSRCVSVQVFWRYHLRRSRRDFFRTAELYRRHLKILDNPVETLWNDLRRDDPLIPGDHSWLVPIGHISDLNGYQTRNRLRINYDPPYIVMVFPMSRMIRAGVKVREPRGLDAVPARHLQWSPKDVPDERIDGDIPLAALGELRWLP